MASFSVEYVVINTANVGNSFSFRPIEYLSYDDITNNKYRMDISVKSRINNLITGLSSIQMVCTLGGNESRFTNVTKGIRATCSVFLDRIAAYRTYAEADLLQSNIQTGVGAIAGTTWDSTGATQTGIVYTDSWVNPFTIPGNYTYPALMGVTCSGSTLSNIRPVIVDLRNTNYIQFALWEEGTTSGISAVALQYAIQIDFTAI